MSNDCQKELIQICSCFSRFGTFVKDCLIYALNRKADQYNLPSAIDKLNKFFSIEARLNVHSSGFFIDLYERNDALGLLLLSDEKKEELWDRVLRADIKMPDIF